MRRHVRQMSGSRHQGAKSICAFDTEFWSKRFDRMDSTLMCARVIRI
jgi:hypothetical protein